MSIKQYIEYRRKGFYHAWYLAGMTRMVVRFVIRLVVTAIIALSVYGGMQYIEDNRTAAVADSKAYSTSLEKVLAQCLGDKEGAVVIGGEYYLCRAIPIGVKL